MAERNRPAFRGSNAAEAEDFVQAVRRTAWVEGKFDYEWMAAYAASQMSGQALRWHMSLPRDVQSSWDKLEVALLDKFAPEQAPVAPSYDPIIPSGAPVELAPWTGRIRVTENATGRFVGYLAKKWSTQADRGFGGATSRIADDALLVEFRPSSALTTFDLVDKSNFHRLALKLRHDRLELDSSGCQSLELICLAPGPKPGSMRYSTPSWMGYVAHVQPAVWKVGVDGSITPTWPNSPQVEIGGYITMLRDGYGLMLVANIAKQMENDWHRKNCTPVKFEFEHV
ncbi:hypothetical protein FS837_012845 [Tulasnella sp. UAMH 9824]|nr:hypothetical protein FS837_012845 [Tulasnella sp. UAMH 9824]